MSIKIPRKNEVTINHPEYILTCADLSRDKSTFSPPYAYPDTRKGEPSSRCIDLDYEREASRVEVYFGVRVESKLFNLIFTLICNIKCAKRKAT